MVKNSCLIYLVVWEAGGRGTVDLPIGRSVLISSIVPTEYVMEISITPSPQRKRI